MPRAKRALKTYEQHKGSMLSMTHDFAPWVNGLSSTLSAAVSQNVDSGLTVENESTSGSQWTGRVGSTTNTGRFTFELKGTAANGDIQVVEFAIVVYDADSNPSVW